MLMDTLWGCLQESKASNHINGNSWLLPADWLLTDGGDVFVMCLTSLKESPGNNNGIHDELGTKNNGLNGSSGIFRVLMILKSHDQWILETSC